MTFIVTFLVGAGVLLIASSLDCSPLKDTFLALVQNKPIDWSGSKACSPATPPVLPGTPDTKPLCADHTCTCYGPDYAVVPIAGGSTLACVKVK